MRSKTCLINCLYNYGTKIKKSHQGRHFLSVKLLVAAYINNHPTGHSTFFVTLDNGLIIYHDKKVRFELIYINDINYNIPLVSVFVCRLLSLRDISCRTPPVLFPVILM